MVLVSGIGATIGAGGVQTVVFSIIDAVYYKNLALPTIFSV